MLRVNFYGGPGVGKSTLAARVYAELNSAGAVSTELVREFIKTWAYEGGSRTAGIRSTPSPVNSTKSTGWRRPASR